MNEFFLLLAHGDSSAAFDPDPVRAGAGAAARFLQAAIGAAPYLLGGVVLAGLLRGMAGGEAIRRALGPPSPGGILRAAAAGFVLPLGALGALPVARGLLAMGVARGMVLAFFLAAAVVDPFSIVFGLSLMGVGPLAACVAAALAWSILGGLLIHRVAGGDPPPGEPAAETVPATAAGRLFLAVSTMADDLAGPSFRDALLAASGAAVLGAVLPPGWLQEAASPPRMAGWLVAAAAGAVACETPLEAMRQAGGLLRDGYGHKVAFALLAFGSGLNLAVLAWLRRGMGLRPGPIAGVLAIGLGLWGLAGWAFDRAGRGAIPGQAFHTHVFDEIGRPNLVALGPRRAAADAWSVATKSAGDRLPALAPLALLAAAGLAARRPRIRAIRSRWARSLDAARPGPGPGSRAWERPLSRRWLAVLGMGAPAPAIAALVFVLYPAPAVLFDEMVPAYTEVQYTVRHGDAGEALVWVDRWEGLIRKLGPATVLRRGPLDAEARRRLDAFLGDVAALRGFLEEGRVEEARTLLGPLAESQRACRRALDIPG